MRAVETGDEARHRQRTLAVGDGNDDGSSTCGIPPTYEESRHQIPRRRRRRVVAQETEERSGKNGRSRDAISATADGSDGIEYLLKLRRHESLCMRIVLTLPRARWYDRFYKAVRTVEGTISFVILCQLLNQHPTNAAPTDANTIMSYRESCELGIQSPFYGRVNCCKLRKKQIVK